MTGQGTQPGQAKPGPSRYTPQLPGGERRICGEHYHDRAHLALIFLAVPQSPPDWHTRHSQLLPPSEIGHHQDAHGIAALPLQQPAGRCAHTPLEAKTGHPCAGAYVSLLDGAF